MLPTGRNFYSIDPKAIPSRLAYDTGSLMAESLVERYLLDNGEYPKSVGLSVWGTLASIRGPGGFLTGVGNDESALELR